MSSKCNKNQLTDEQIEKIRDRYASEVCSQEQLSVEYGVSVYQIKKTVKGVQKFKLAPSERFWSKVNVLEPDECWEWLGRKDKDGYGLCEFDGKTKRAHRIAYIDWFGPIPNGQVIRHKVCRNRACCNPNHLLSGTSKDNNDDKREDGTIYTKLPYLKRFEIKFLSELGKSTEDIAKFYNVSPKTIKRVLEELQDEETQLLYQERAKKIEDKELAKNGFPLKLIIKKVIGDYHG